MADHVDIDRLLQEARRAGVRRVVLLSSQIVSTRPHLPSHAGLARLEGAVRASGLKWTVLQASGIMSNDLWWAATVRDHRTVFTPYADVALPVVAPYDLASVAAAVLSDGGHAGRTYVLTGPEDLSPRDRAALLGSTLGTDLDLVELTDDDAKAELSKQMPEPVAEGTLQILGHPTAEERAVSTTVTEILGRPATEYAAWLDHVAGAFR